MLNRKDVYALAAIASVIVIMTAGILGKAVASLREVVTIDTTTNWEIYKDYTDAWVLLNKENGSVCTVFKDGQKSDQSNCKYPPLF